MITFLSAIAFAALASPEPAVRANPKKSDKIVCKRDKSARLGSHLGGGGKTCLKQSEWDAIAEHNERAKRKMIDSPIGYKPEPVATD